MQSRRARNLGIEEAKFQKHYALLERIKALEGEAAKLKREFQQKVDLLEDDLPYHKKLKIRLRLISTLAEEVTDWGETEHEVANFAIKKANCLALLTETPYFKVTRREIEQAGRSRLVPSSAYQKHHASSAHMNFARIASRLEFGDIIVIEITNFVCAVIYVKNILFITVRGTAERYDWRINLDIRKKPANNSRAETVHKGFLEAARELQRALLARCGHRNRPSKIVVTGHSLGGAVAAILYSFGEIQITRDASPQRIDDCYTFASPRYANAAYMKATRAPYNLVNDNDIVPYLTPRAIGYADFPFIFDAFGRPVAGTGKGAANMVAVSRQICADVKVFFQWLLFLDRRGPEYVLVVHGMEMYRRRIRGELASRSRQLIL